MRSHWRDADVPQPKERIRPNRSDRDVWRGKSQSYSCHHFTVVVIIITRPQHELQVSSIASNHPASNQAKSSCSVISSPPNTDIPGTLPKPHLILTDKHPSPNHPPPTTSSSALTLTPLPRPCNTPHTSIPRRPSRNTSRGSSSSIRARSARTSPANLPLPRSPHRSSSIRSTAVGQASTAIPPTSAESLLQRPDALAEGVVLGFDEFHLAPVRGCIGVVLHGGVGALARALGGGGRRLRTGVVWRAGCGSC